MNKVQWLTTMGAAAAALGATAPAAAQATFAGPTPYTSFADSPFAGTSFSYFYLEDLQDGLANTAGLVTNNPVFVGAQGSVSDSVEFTPNGGSLFNGSGLAGVDVSFSAAVLGALPTHAGLVWTDGRGTIVFEAFNALGVSLGTVTGNHADADQTGETGEDRFYGVIFGGGISRLRITNTDGGIEADHIQYGLASQVGGAVPEPATWAMMIGGLGLTGASLRRRKVKVAYP